MAYKKFTASEDMLKPDARYNSKLVSKFINSIMWDGKKSVAQKIFYDAMDQVVKKVKDVPPLELFETAINNVKPYVEVRSKRVGGANYQVPMQVNRRRQQSLAFRWIIGACREQTGRPMSERLAGQGAKTKTRRTGKVSFFLCAFAFFVVKFFLTSPPRLVQRRGRPRELLQD